ncbi:unnamed protein product [Echinostoma caproni]|uniref:Uncharacterized protein n=1 Tax=Echinostoma caproni TaxID=27848 RepID=A0A183AQX4_9TREM|nr:unnamed protein product [Echinostoma caproni]
MLSRRQTLGWQNTIKSTASSTQSAVAKRDKLTNMDQYSLAARIFHRYDVLETSYHFCVYRTEIHFCDETRDGGHLSQMVVPNGYIKVHLYGLELDWYPYHVESLPQVRWSGSRDFREARDNWLASLNRAHFPQTRSDQMKQPPADPLLNLPTDTSTPLISVMSSPDLRVIQSVLILRICDLDVSRVSFPDSNVPCPKSSGPATTTTPSRSKYSGEELPSAANLFLASDKKLHCLADSTNLITVELRTTYRPHGTIRSRTMDQSVGMYKDHERLLKKLAVKQFFLSETDGFLP